MKEIFNSDVQFRYIGIKENEYEIPGICFCYANKKSAKEFFTMIYDYMTLKSGEKQFNIELRLQDDNCYTLEMIIETPEKILKTIISDIIPSDIEKIPKNLRSVSYYVILAGYDKAGEFTLLPTDKYHLFKKELLIDGKKVEGASNCSIDWDKVF